MVIALDIDGILDVYGDFFQESIPGWQKAGIKVGILTARLESDKEAVANVLDKAGVKMDFLMFKPNEFEDKQIPNGVWKGILCRLINADILFDDMQRDDPTFIADFAEVVENTRIFAPVEYGKQIDQNGKTVNDYAEQIIQALGGKARQMKQS